MASRVLLVEGDVRRRMLLRDALGACGLDVRESASSTEAMGRLKLETMAGLVVADEARHLALQGLCAQVRRGTPGAPVFVLLQQGSDTYRLARAVGPEAVLVPADAVAEQVAAQVGVRLGARTPDAWSYEKRRAVRRSRLWEAHLVRGPRGEDGMLAQLSDQFARDGDLRSEFLGAATQVAQLDHPNIARLTKVGGSTDIPFFVAECRAGELLRDLERRTRGPGAGMSWRAAAHVAAELAAGLGEAHRAGLVHGAVAPETTWVGADGRVELLFLGVAGFLGAIERTLRAPVGIIIHHPHLAPEQVREQPLDGRTDVFLLGVLLHELLSGRPLFLRETPAATREAVLVSEIAEPRSAPPALAELVLACLERNPAYRPQSAAALRGKLETILAGGPGASDLERDEAGDEGEDGAGSEPGAGLLSRWFKAGSGASAAAREPPPLRRGSSGAAAPGDTARAELTALFGRGRGEGA